ncbi:PAS domain S-box protein [Alteromonadaceae bacterium M269]|nr:PAS domain S-box protein [Alteromonadaceae bacterium M269]
MIRYLLPIIVGLIGAVVSVSIAFIVQGLQAQQVRENTLAANNAQILAVEKGIATHLEVLYSLKALFDASDEVSRSEFTAYATPFLERHEDIQALQWIQRIEKDQRQAYVDKARAEGFPTYDVREKSSDNQMLPAPIREFYYPVYYLEPYAGNERTLGHDSPENPKRVAAIQRAATTGKESATGTFTLIQETGDQLGLLIFSPVYRDKNGNKSEQNLEGLVLVVIRVGEVIRHALGDSFNNTDLYVEDITESDVAAAIFGVMDYTTVESELISAKVIDVAGRQWRITAFPHEGTSKLSTSFLPATTLITGLLFFGFITYTIILLIRRRRLIEATVLQRTQELRSSEEKIQAIVDNTADGIMTIKADGSIETYNKACIQIFGYDPNQAIGQHIKTMLSPRYHKDCDDYLQGRNREQQGDINNFEIEGVRNNGDLFSLDLSITEMSFQGRRVFNAIVRDITTRKQEEEKLHKANAELEEFAYRTSHDLRSPLSSSITLLDITEEAVQKGDKEMSANTIGLVRKSLKSLDGLVKDILTLTQTKNMEEEAQLIDIENILDEALSKFSNMQNVERLDIQRDLTFDDELVTQKSRFTLVLENLVSNAIKYQDTAKDNSFIRISTEQQNDAFVLAVQDNGLGIPEDHQAKLFSMFKRFHPRVSFGSGLGLYMMKKSADVMGGEISFEDTGEGSKFTLRVPISPKSAE